jgi:hypothetical protein
MATVGLEPHLAHETSLLSLPLDHLLVVGSLPQLIYLNLFSLACVINIRHISSHKMASVGLEPHLVHETSLLSLPLDHLLVVGSLTQLIHLNLFSLACIIKIQPFSNHKMTSVGLEPQWYITQPVVFTTKPLARCWKPNATYSPDFFL